MVETGRWYHLCCKIRKGKMKKLIIILSIFILGCATSKGPREIYFTSLLSGLIMKWPQTDSTPLRVVVPAAAA